MGLLKTMLHFLRNVFDRLLEVDAFSLAATLAYYAIFSIAPLLLLSIHLASLFLDRTTAVEALTNELISVIGPAGSDAIKQMLDAAGTAQPEGWAGLIGFAVLLFAATGFVGSLQDALDKIWHAPPRPSGLWAFIKAKLFSFSLILAAAFLLLISLVLSTAMTAVAGRFTSALGLEEGIVELVVVTANFLLAALIFAAIFKYVPSVPVSWKAAIAGGFFTAVLFAVRWGKTKTEVAENGIAALRECRAPIAGAVVTQVNMEAHAKGAYGDAATYYGNYKKYYLE